MDVVVLVIDALLETFIIHMHMNRVGRQIKAKLIAIANIK